MHGTHWDNFICGIDVGLKADLVAHHNWMNTNDDENNTIHHYPQDTIKDDAVDQISASLLCTQTRDTVIHSRCPKPQPTGCPSFLHLGLSSASFLKRAALSKQFSVGHRQICVSNFTKVELCLRIWISWNESISVRNVAVRNASVIRFCHCIQS